MGLASALVWSLAAGAQAPEPTDSAMSDMHMTDAAMSDMHDMHMEGAAGALHMRMTAPGVPTATDSARMVGIRATLRNAVAKYRDIAVAEADGFRPFLPNVKQPIYHYTRRAWAINAAFRFDPAKPTSLLYRQNADSTWTLVGAMYTAPRSASERDLNARVPVGLAQWHEHVDILHPAA